MRNITKGLLGAAALAVLVAAPAAKAATIIVPVTLNTWETYLFGGANDPTQDFWQDLDGDTLEFAVTVASHSVLTVTDGWNDGDRFNVSINGVSVGQTSVPTIDGDDQSDNWAAASVDPKFSHARYVLNAGTYLITGFATASPYGAGQGALLLGVPEPATWAMMLVGFGGIGAVMRKARRTAAAVTA
jgi:hypothetical protein